MLETVTSVNSDVLAVYRSALVLQPEAVCLPSDWTLVCVHYVVNTAASQSAGYSTTSSPPSPVADRRLRGRQGASTCPVGSETRRGTRSDDGRARGTFEAVGRPLGLVVTLSVLTLTYSSAHAVELRVDAVNL